MKAYLLQQVHFDDWANARILKQLQANTDKYNNADLEKAHSLFNHIVNVQFTWLKRIESSLNRSGNESKPTQVVPALWELRDIANEHLNLAENKAGFLAILESTQDLNVSISYVNSHGAAFTNTLTDLFLHFTHHGHYHRGQINLLLRKIGAEPQLIDYIYYTRQLS